MTKNTKFVGLDVHAATVVIAVGEEGGEVRSLGTVANEIGAIRRVLGKLGKPDQLRVRYEAGPTGFALYWDFSRLGDAVPLVGARLEPELQRVIVAVPAEASKPGEPDAGNL